VGIAIISPGLTEFTLAMLSANLAFVSGSWLRGLATGGDGPALRVLYDGACPRCRASMALVVAADPGRVVEPVDLTAVNVRSIHRGLTLESCLRSMHVVSASGRVRSGYDAVRSIGARLPLFWPIAAVAHLPGVAGMGRKVYNHLAATRPRDVTCTDETCGIHSRTPRNVARLRDSAPDSPKADPSPSDSREVPHP
jgi:predicted DCC family thiol-disulfide oxidoreductase YuxK